MLGRRRERRGRCEDAAVRGKEGKKEVIIFLGCVGEEERGVRGSRRIRERESNA